MPIDSTHYVFTAVFFLEWCSSVSYCYRGNAVCQCVIVSVNHYLSIYLSICLSIYLKWFRWTTFTTVWTTN